MSPMDAVWCKQGESLCLREQGLGELLNVRERVEVLGDVLMTNHEGCGNAVGYRHYLLRT